MNNFETEGQTPPDITGYWTEGIWVDSCSVCGQKKQRTVNLHFNHQEIRFCEPCAIALREIMTALINERLRRKSNPPRSSGRTGNRMRGDSTGVDVGVLRGGLM